MVVECIPLPKEVGDMAPIYFKVITRGQSSLTSTALSWSSSVPIPCTPNHGCVTIVAYNRDVILGARPIVKRV